MRSPLTVEAECEVLTRQAAVAVKDRVQPEPGLAGHRLQRGRPGILYRGNPVRRLTQARERRPRALADAECR